MLLDSWQDGNGFLSGPELRDMMVYLKMPTEHGKSVKLFRIIDTNKNGKIEMDELRHFLANN